MKNLKEIKEWFLKKYNIVDSISNTSIDLIIDETIEEFINGNLKLDGKIPETDEEILNAINIAVLLRKSILDGFGSKIKTYKGNKL